MLNIKNFKLYEPSPSQREIDLLLTGKSYDYLISEDGQDWYECQKLYSKDTIKIMYDIDNVVISVVDAPVPQRGNIFAVSMFNPVNMSVAEVSALPVGFETDSGTWVFDGTSVYQDSGKLADRIQRINASAFYQRLNRASSYLAILQSCATVNESQDGDDALILELQQYLAALRNIDLSQPSPAWPMPPVTMP